MGSTLHLCAGNRVDAISAAGLGFVSASKIVGGSQDAGRLRRRSAVLFRPCYDPCQIIGHDRESHLDARIKDAEQIGTAPGVRSWRKHETFHRHHSFPQCAKVSSGMRSDAVPGSGRSAASAWDILHHVGRNDQLGRDSVCPAGLPGSIVARTDLPQRPRLRMVTWSLKCV
jgi:hypothetical protein